MLSQIRCVAFDAVGTLIFPDPPVAEIYARVGGKYGSLLTENEVRERFRSAFGIEHVRGSRTNEDEERRRWRRLVERVFGPADIEACFEELFEHFGLAKSWRCFPDAEETLRELSQRGYDLILASNFDGRVHAICEGHAELACFSVRVVSSEVGRGKPHSEFYRALIEQSHYEAHEVLMVGDDWENDIRGAREFGIEAVFLDRSQQEAISRKENVTVINTLAGVLELLP